MKNILFLALIAYGLNAKAQIALENTYNDASTIAGGNQLMVVKFEVSGEQYVKIDRGTKIIDIYDMNHSLIKVINCSAFPIDYATTAMGDVLYFSESLFDTDPGMEFMYIYQNIFQGPYHTEIYNEDGSILFSDTGAAMIRFNIQLQQYPIYNTSLGTKMILSYSNGQAKVFSLPGTLTTSIGTANESLMNSSNLISNPYPNPTNSTTRIDYTFPKGVNQGEIVFYDLQGKEIKRYKVDKTFDHLLISTADIPAGTYFFQLQIPQGGTSEGKKMVVIK